MLLPGFADPVLGSQACFRAVLDAMSRPGSRHAVGHPPTPPAPLSPATAAVLLTLLDADTPLWLAPEFDAAWDWLAFHTGAPRATLGAARFVCAATLPPLAALDAGTDLAPEASATLVLQVHSLDAGPDWTLSGPGIAATATLRAGLPPDFQARWTANRALAPRGIDLILCAGDAIAALPRSVAVA